MANKECCRTCGHCSTNLSSGDLWCRLRGLAVHSEMASFVFCHHWSRSAPSLPDLNGEIKFDKQLDFGSRVLSPK